MRNVLVKSYGCAVAAIELKARQAQVKVSGLLTDRNIGTVLSDVDRIARGALVRSISIDMSGAVVAMTWPAMVAAPLKLSQEVRELPIALAVPPLVSEIFYEHAWVLAKLGYLRGVFPANPLQAQDWAGLKAEARSFRIPVSAR